MSFAPLERFADPIDEANALAASINESAVANARAANAPERHPDFDGVHCLDCDSPIHPDRLKLEKIRCTDCQSDLEALRKKQSRGLR